MTSKFALFVNLGTITVPSDYEHATRLGMFKQRHQGGKMKSIYSYNDDITDENFSNPSRVMKPGDKFRVSVFQQIAGRSTTSEERMTFLASQNGVYTGAQGASLVFDLRRKALPRKFWYVSFDDHHHLWEDPHGLYRVPYLGAFPDEDYYFRLGDFADVWDCSSNFFCFRDVK